MARPLRIEYAGALYHITARGNAKQNIYFDDTDRQQFLLLLSRACKQYQWQCFSYCLMSNHYHLLLQTEQPNLSKGMHYLNGAYTQKFNYRHNRVGHLFQGRFKSILVQADTYLQELARYIVQNPVRAGMVETVADWPWSSYRATMGLGHAPLNLALDLLLSHFSAVQAKAQSRYKEFVNAGTNQPSPLKNLKNQVYLGSDEFVESSLRRVENPECLQDIPKKQLLTPRKPLEHYKKSCLDRDSAMTIAYSTGHFSMLEIGLFFGVSRATVGRAVAKKARLNPISDQE